MHSFARFLVTAHPAELDAATRGADNRFDAAMRLLDAFAAGRALAGGAAETVRDLFAFVLADVGDPDAGVPTLRMYPFAPTH
jgi:hypothetical protein